VYLYSLCHSAHVSSRLYVSSYDVFLFAFIYVFSLCSLNKLVFNLCHHDSVKVVTEEPTKMDYKDCLSQNGWSLEDYVEEYLELYHDVRWDDEM